MALSGVTKVGAVIDDKSFDNVLKCTMERRKNVVRGWNNIMMCD